MKIAVIMSGLIKNYNHLNDLGIIFKDESQHEYKIFGQCFDFLCPPKRSRDNIEYKGNEPLDYEFLDNYYTDIKYIPGDTFAKYDEDGFSNRIISQWTNIKEGLLLAEKYEIENNYEFDLIIRARADISIDKNMLLEIIDSAFRTEQIFWRSDCVVVGIASRMKQVLRLADHYYEYHELPVFKEQTEAWLARNITNNRVRSNAESERLLMYHVINLFGRAGVAKYPHHFNTILRS